MFILDVLKHSHQLIYRFKSLMNYIINHEKHAMNEQYYNFEALL